MRNVLVTGANGQLGSELKEASTAYVDRFHIFYIDRNSLDLSSLEQVEDFILTNRIDSIINTVAYTAVDLAEKEIEKAEMGNVTIPSLLAEISAKHNLHMVQISTDFIFDGKHCLPYSETDIPNPISVYGKTKWLGEQKVQLIDPNSCIIRTSWLYSKYGNNFLKTIQRLGKERLEIRVIFDQIGSPTWARDLAFVILSAVDKRLAGVYNYSNEGVASWYDFAFEIFKVSELDCKLIPIETKDYPTPAMRPHYSILNKGKIKSELKIEIPHWKESLRKCISEIKNEK